MNVGYGFVSADANAIASMNEYENSSWSAGLSASVSVCGKANIGMGYNFSRNKAKATLELVDINGDGLPDLLENGKVKFNTGNGFAETQDLWNVDGAEKNVSVSHGLHQNAAAPIKIALIYTITPFLNLSETYSISRTENALMDVDGDGLPDYVVSPKDEVLSYRKNMTGRTNLLKTITLPFGATVNLDYERSKNTYEMPNSKFVLKSVETLGGDSENGATKRLTTFEYEGGLYDRYDREFLGFAKVTTHQHDTESDDAIYRSVYQTFSNKSYTDKGLLLSVVATDKEGEKISETTNTYTPIKTDKGGVFQALTQSKSSEFINGESISQTENFTYDKIGNVTHYTSVAGDEVSVDITYHNDQSIQNQRVPKSVVVKGGNVQRSRSTKIDPMTGDITEISLENGENTAVYNMEYDSYGNITKLTRPKNYNGDRFWNAYIYDTEVHSFVTDIDNAYNYHSYSEFDYRFGVPTRTTDINGNSVSYEYDDFGRLTKVTSPYETDYTLKFRYDLANKTAETKHFTKEGDITTTTICDDLMRPVKVKKSAVVDGVSGEITSGVMAYDAFGRCVKEFLPTFNGGKSAGFSETKYDAHDRKTMYILPDGSVRKFAFEVEDGNLKTTVTDAENHVSETYTDARQRTVKTVRKGDGEDIVVEYDFNPLGELLSVTHPNKTQTLYTYDQLGNKLSVDNPDAGKTTFTYDPAGNLLTKQTANLAQIKNGGFIKYLYDYERLAEVQYPQNITNRIQYTYGDADATDNRVGRVTLVQDASGGTEFFYGKLGETTKTVRTIMLSTADVRTYVSEAEYDSWNRIRQMKYPDGETVTYGYDGAGQLKTMTSEKDGNTYLLVDDMRYDLYGNVTYKKYGNGTESRYTYDPLRQRLTNLSVQSSQGNILDATYSYDKIDSCRFNTCPIHRFHLSLHQSTTQRSETDWQHFIFIRFERKPHLGGGRLRLS